MYVWHTTHLWLCTQKHCDLVLQKVRGSGLGFELTIFIEDTTVIREITDGNESKYHHEEDRISLREYIVASHAKITANTMNCKKIIFLLKFKKINPQNECNHNAQQNDSSSINKNKMAATIDKTNPHIQTNGCICRQIPRSEHAPFMLIIFILTGESGLQLYIK